MSGATGGDLAQIGGLRNGLGHRHWDVGGEARDVGVVLRRFAARSSDHVPHLPPHELRGEQLADRIEELARRVERTRDAMVAADRWLGTTAARWLYDRESERQTVRDAWGGARTLSGRVDRVHESTARLLRVGGGRVWRSSADEVRALLRRGPAGSRALDRAASGLARASAFVRSPAVRAVTRVGGRAFAATGIALSTADVVNGYREGDTEQLATGTLGVGAGAAMLMVGCPPAMLAGAVVAGGLLVWEYRAEIGAAGRAVADGVGDMVGAAARFVGGLF